MLNVLSYDKKTKKLKNVNGKEVRAEPIGSPLALESRVSSFNPAVLRDLHEVAPEGANGVVVGSFKPYRFAKNTGPPLTRSKALKELEDELQIYLVPVQYYKVYTEKQIPF